MDTVAVDHPMPDIARQVDKSSVHTDGKATEASLSLTENESTGRNTGTRGDQNVLYVRRPG